MQREIWFHFAPDVYDLLPFLLGEPHNIATAETMKSVLAEEIQTAQGFFLE